MNNLLIAFFFLSLLAVIFWVFSWPFRKKKSGSLLLKVKQNHQKRWVFWLGIFNAATAVYITSIFLARLNSGFPRYTNLILEMMQVTSLWIIAILLLASELNPPELRENGICAALSFINWQRISSYQWLPSTPNMLMIRYQRRLAWLPGILMIEFPASYHDGVNEILSERVGK